MIVSAGLESIQHPVRIDNPENGPCRACSGTKAGQAEILRRKQEGTAEMAIPIKINVFEGPLDLFFI